MGSVVRELQQDALNRQVVISDLLRKALVVARKLGLTDFQAWINKELSGYATGEEIPEYRRLSGQARAWNPYRGWIPIIFSSPKQEEWLTQRNATQSAAELETLLGNQRDVGQLHMPFSAQTQRYIFEDAPFESEATLFVQYSSLAKILDSVRTIILNWALKLEEDGILGEGLAFSDEDKAQAKVQPQSVVNFYGTVQSPQVQQNVRDAVQVSLVRQLDLEAVKAIVQDLAKARQELGLTGLDLATTADIRYWDPCQRTSLWRRHMQRACPLPPGDRNWRDRVPVYGTWLEIHSTRSGEAA
jgi:hypothetical protein